MLYTGYTHGGSRSYVSCMRFQRAYRYIHTRTQQETLHGHLKMVGSFSKSVSAKWCEIINIYMVLRSNNLFDGRHVCWCQQFDARWVVVPPCESLGSQQKTKRSNCLLLKHLRSHDLGENLHRHLNDITVLILECLTYFGVTFRIKSCHKEESEVSGNNQHGGSGGNTDNVCSMKEAVTYDGAGLWDHCDDLWTQFCSVIFIKSSLLYFVALPRSAGDTVQPRPHEFYDLCCTCLHQAFVTLPWKWVRAHEAWRQSVVFWLKRSVITGLALKTEQLWMMNSVHHLGGFIDCLGWNTEDKN